MIEISTLQTIARVAADYPMGKFDTEWKGSILYLDVQAA